MAELHPMRNRTVLLLGSTAALFLLAASVSSHGQRRNVPADSHHAASLPPASSATQAPAPIVRAPNTGVQVSANPERPGAGPGPRNSYKGEHLGEWMMAHNNLSLPEQQAALDREPGFHDLPPQTQQRIHDRLAQLATMTPDARQRMIRRTEMMEKLPPNQRAEVRSALLGLGSLPPDQKRVVARAFRDLRGLPPEQRLPLLNSRYGYLNQGQRYALEQLMRVEPLLPPDEHP